MRSFACGAYNRAMSDARAIYKEGFRLFADRRGDEAIHLFVKRVKAGDALLGTTAEHRARIAELLNV